MIFVTEYRRKPTVTREQLAVAMMEQAWRQILRYHSAGRFGLR